MRSLPACFLLPGLLALGLIAGCGSAFSVNTESFNKINNDMSMQEVESVLGSGKVMAIEDFKARGPDGSLLGIHPTKVRVWDYQGRVIVVIFQDDKVVAKLSKGL